MKRVTSRRTSNWVDTLKGVVVRPGMTHVVTDEQAAALDPEEFDVSEAETVFDEVTFTDVKVTYEKPDTPPTVVTKPAKKGRTRQ